MASIDTSLIRRELRAIEATSKRVSRLLYRALEKLEEDPAQFPELDYVHPRIEAVFAGVTLRKIKIVSGRHNFRIIIAHWSRGDYEDHVDGIYAFARQPGYPIDWDWVQEVLGELE